ncbi:hypothetical protein BHE74_00041353 [Ensete ventricosum]|nr:hypothetical protein GW17_00057244 [Ensete ventricosum]RWW52231.1 hypothetical protein BHE74_00041353 [Ensete ventricosum]RZS18795.1 hypothetical protein BHM03_00051120 [Ensete ventricosum]
MLRLVAPRRGRLLLGGGHRHQRAAPLQEPRRLDGDKDGIGNFSATAASAPLHEPRRLDGDNDGIGNFSTAAASNPCLKSQGQSTRNPKEEEEEEERTNQSKAVEKKGKGQTKDGTEVGGEKRCGAWRRANRRGERTREREEGRR